MICQHGICITPDPVPVGPVLTFYIQGAAAEDVSAPAFTAKITPNPISDATSLKLDTPNPGQLSLSLYNFKGQKILSRSGLDLRQGANVWQWKELVSEKLPAGIYLLRLDAGGRATHLKAMVLH
ncbi:MAG: T9SS type A sorting domain-containing protein [Candidatus Syntrophosphaera sp.]|nr:T9SS type A sorting domain-containing protein [Candidatus Syntrophosphaera sp.]